MTPSLGLGDSEVYPLVVGFRVCKLEIHKFREVNHHFMIYFYAPCPIAILNKRRGIVTVVGLLSNKCFDALSLHRSCLVRFDGQ